jgi:transposase
MCLQISSFENDGSLSISREPYEAGLLGHFSQKFLQFAAYYGFVPSFAVPKRPETKGKIESIVRFVKQNFWPGISFASLADLNQQVGEFLDRRFWGILHRR